MLWAGVAILGVGVLWAAFKGWVVWDIAQDLFNGGGAPTLDFPVFCPIPLAVGASMVASRCTSGSPSASGCCCGGSTASGSRNGSGN